MRCDSGSGVVQGVCDLVKQNTISEVVLDEAQAKVVEELVILILRFSAQVMEEDGVDHGMVANALLSAWINFVRYYDLEHQTAAVMPNLQKHLIEMGNNKMKNTEKH